MTRIEFARHLAPAPASLYACFVQRLDSLVQAHGRLRGMHRMATFLYSLAKVSDNHEHNNEGQTPAKNKDQQNQISLLPQSTQAP